MNLEEFKKELDRRYMSLPGWYWTLRRWFLYTITIEWRRDIKWFFQRHIRGYDDTATWATGDYLSKLIVKHLKLFRKAGKMGVPGPFIVDGDDNDLTKGTKKFNDTLDKMIEGWEYFANEDDIHAELYEKYTKNRKNDEKLPKEYFDEINSLSKKAEENAKLFITYINCLWD